MKCLAIITARGGSKRIPRKNIRSFHGRPVISYGIMAALQSELFTQVMVSTDDEEIAAVAKKFGASIPFRRSNATANDYATTADVLLEVLDQYQKAGQQFDYACCIYPTAPFVTAEKLQEAFRQLQERQVDVVFPVVRYSASIWRSLQRYPDGKVAFYWPENALRRSQDLPEAYYDCGQFYFFSVPAFLNEKSLMTVHTYGLPVSNMEAQDIDNEEDWQLAELKYSRLIR